MTVQECIRRAQEALAEAEHFAKSGGEKRPLLYTKIANSYIKLAKELRKSNSD